jgi:predicted Rossmann fold nucleotide-binding protein DprA/Smf involved in DNA uptake
LILSEYPPATRPATYHFPQRNRLISGLAQGTVVIEAGIGSGSLITARDAIVQGRDVFALPANVGSRGAEGTNGLIRDGATPVLSTADILDPYRYLFSKTLAPDSIGEVGDASRADLSYLERMGVVELTRPQEAQKPATTLAAAAKARDETEPTKTTSRKRRTTATKKTAENDTSRDGESVAAAAQKKQTPDEVLASLTPVQRAVLEAIPDDRSVTADALGDLGYPYGDMIAALTMLEILGLIQKLPGALYTRS